MCYLEIFIIVYLSDYHHLHGEGVEPMSHFINRWNMIIWVCVVLNRKVVHSIKLTFRIYHCGGHLQSQCSL